MNNSSQIKVAIKAAKAAGELSLDFFNKEKEISYKEQEEIVTDVDIKCEDVIKSIIKKEFADHAFLGEEKGKEGSSEYTWVIDPIDGTVNYSRGIKLYGISIALVKDKKVVLGVVYNPLTNELFSAQKGKGAFLNGQKIKVSDVSQLSKSVVYATELYRSKEYVSSLFDKIKRFRITSSSAYETCLVACGRTDGFIKVTKVPWGFAAANLIVEEAGGKVTNFNDSEWNIESNKMLVSNAKLHQEIIALLE